MDFDSHDVLVYNEGTKATRKQRLTENFCSEETVVALKFEKPVTQASSSRAPVNTAKQLACY
jgi:hypothetical protein